MTDKFDPCLDCPCRLVNNDIQCGNYFNKSCHEIETGCEGKFCELVPEKCKYAAEYNLNIVHKCGYEFSRMTSLPHNCPGCDEKIRWK